MRYFSVAGKIHITENTKRLLENHPEYITIERGEIEVKVKLELFR